MKIIIALTLSLLSLCSVAQTNIGNRNNTASCDSTCMAQATAVSQESNLQQRVIPCVSGFSGTRLQTRVRQPDGNWGPWVDKDISQCNCAPTTKTENNVCAEPLKGTYTSRSNWTCTSAKSGVWSEWTVETNNCYTPCVALPKQTQTINCASGYTGSQTQERTSSCSADDSKPPTWSSWNTVSSNCTATDSGGGGGSMCPCGIPCYIGGGAWVTYPCGSGS